MAKIQKLEFNNPEVLLILPEAIESDGSKRCDAEILRLTEWNAKTLPEKLNIHYLEKTKRIDHVKPYTDLYNGDGKLDANKMNNLLNEKSRGRGPTDDTLSFENRDDFVPMISRSLTRLRDEIRTRKRNGGDFRIRPDEEDREDADSLEVPRQIEGLKRAVKAFVEQNNTPDRKDDRIPPDDAVEWLDGTADGFPLKMKMEIVANYARDERVIFHEPHHDLTPGMLLIDEIFRAMVEEVIFLVCAIDASSLAKALSTQGSAELKAVLKDILDFANGLETGTGASGKFGTYILRAGIHPLGNLSYENKNPYHIDPARIELFLDGPEIRAVSIIVGGWAGGTHSQGHTSG